VAEMSHLDRLLGFLESNPDTHKHVPAANLWAATWGPEAKMWGLYAEMIACTPQLGESIKSLRKHAAADTEALRVSTQLNKTIATVIGLALVQTEWEENNSVKVPPLREQ